MPEIAVMTDVALDPYNINGHDGIVRDGVIVNDESVEALVKMTVAQAEAGADIIGPSDMMDGRIGAMRAALESAGHTNMSAFSAMRPSTPRPFTVPSAMRSARRALLTGDKKTYQMDPGNSNEALRLIERDLREGADMVMVKPGMSISRHMSPRVRHASTRLLAAYQVSGEYAMIRGCGRSWAGSTAMKAMMESLRCFQKIGLFRCDLDLLSPAKSARALG